MIEFKRYCERCGCDLILLDLFLEKEDVRKDSYYIQTEGFYNIKKGCNQECENVIYYIEKEINGKIFKWWIKDWKKEGNLSSKLWKFFILDEVEMKNLLGERIKGKLRDYNLIRIKENDLYKTYEIFGYNGINLFLKQKIGIKKDGR